MAENEATEWTKEELRNIRTNLPKDWANTLAKAFNITSGSVRNILSGVAKNDAVVIEAVALAKEHKLKMQTTLLAAKEDANLL